MSTTYQEGDRLNFPSGSDFTNSGVQSTPTYQIVKFGSSATAGQIVPASASTDMFLGVIKNVPTSTNSPFSGPYQTVAEIHARNAQGAFKVQAGGSFSVNAYLTSDSSGHAIATTTPGDQVIGIALQASTGSGQIVEYLPTFYIHA